MFYFFPLLLFLKLKEAVLTLIQGPNTVAPLPSQAGLSMSSQQRWMPVFTV